MTTAYGFAGGTNVTDRKEQAWRALRGALRQATLAIVLHPAQAVRDREYVRGVVTAASRSYEVKLRGALVDYHMRSIERHKTRMYVLRDRSMADARRVMLERLVAALGVPSDRMHMHFDLSNVAVFTPHVEDEDEAEASGDD